MNWREHSLNRPRVVPLSVDHLKAMLETKADEWRGFRKHAPIARQMVRKLVEGRIVFTPDREARRYTFLATGNPGDLLQRDCLSTSGGVPNGIAPFLGGTLLRRAAWGVRWHLADRVLLMAVFAFGLVGFAQNPAPPTGGKPRRAQSRHNTGSVNSSAAASTKCRTT